MANLIFQSTINLMETFTIVYFTLDYLVVNKRYNYTNFVIIWLLLFLEVSFFNYQSVPYLIETGSQILTLLIGIYGLSDENPIIKLFIPIFSYVILYFCNVTVLFSSAFFLASTVNELPSQDYFYLIIIVSKIFFFSVCYIIPKFRKHKAVSFLSSKWLILIPLLFMLFILAMNFLELILRGIINYNLLYLSIVLLIASCILLYFLLNFIEKDSEKRTHEMFVVQQLRFQKENMDDIREMNEEIRKIKHDMKHKLSYVVEGLKDNKVNEMIAMLETSNTEIDRTNVISFSSDETLNYILQSKNKFANSKGIKLQCEIAYTKSTNIKDEDLIVLLGNLMDNAIEHTIENGKVLLSMSTIKGLLHIKVTNPAKSNNIDTKTTSKIDKKNHGFGLKSIHNIVDKYEGSIEERNENNYFIVDIILKA